VLLDRAADAVRDLGAAAWRCAQHVQQLDHEQRVAAGLAAEERDRGRVRVGDLLPRERLDALGAEPREVQHACALRRAPEELGDRRVRARLGVAVAADGEHGQRAETRSEESEEVQGAGIGGVQVVEEQEQRRLERGRGEGVVNGLEQEEPVLGGRRVEPAMLREQEIGDRRHRVALLAQRSRDLAEGDVRGRAARLPRSPPRDLEAPLGGEEGGFTQQAALADARFPRAQERAPATHGGALEGGGHRPELRVPPDRRRHGPRIPSRAEHVQRVEGILER
jgi:hypothetical protein